MSQESPLDIPYRLHPRLVSSIKSSGSMVVSGAEQAVEVPLDMFQALMMFSEPRTARQAFDMLDVDVDLDEFGRIVDGFVEHGLLRRDQASDDGPSLRELLDPAVFGDAARVDEIAGWMRAGRAIIIPDALHGDLAEAVHDDLQRLTEWTPSESGHDFFHHRSCVVDRIAGRSPALTRCGQLFTSAATRRFMAELSGQDCAGESHAAASWYRPGEYALPHDDFATGYARSVAFIWYLTKDWRQEWGGALFWCPTGQYIRPGFNVLIMFRVMPANVHLVCPVALGATARRLTINGFWHRSVRSSPPDRIPEAALVSPRAYGPPPPEASGSSPVLVL
ncbi:MAG TPA: 2OG-Fe(II) oxygenase family protein [Kofleriaceae bacterium]